jgi:hypothetical protein
LQIRNEYINIYYRGGNILKIERKNDKYYSTFNEKYFKIAVTERKMIIKKKLSKQINTEMEAEEWVDNIQFIKQFMDEYFAKYSKSEREFQQLVARENNNSVISNDTDYFITDIEYTNSESKQSRFDLIGLKWTSSSQERKNKNNCRMVLIEMKYGDGALIGTAGIKKHLSDIENFCDKKNTQLKILKEETISAFKQLRTLGLVRFGKNENKNEIEKLSEEIPEFILLFANHKPAKTKLESEFKDISNLKNADVKIATSNFMGYGLYEQNMLTIEEFKKSILNK